MLVEVPGKDKPVMSSSAVIEGVRVLFYFCFYINGNTKLTTVSFVKVEVQELGEGEII